MCIQVDGLSNRDSSDVGLDAQPVSGGSDRGATSSKTFGTGGMLGLEHDPRYIKSKPGRTYMSVQLDNNVVRWTEPFLRRMAAAGPKAELAGLTLGYPQSLDPGELVVRAQGNRLEAPAAVRTRPSLLINAADYNQRLLSNRHLRLPAGAQGQPAARRAAGKAVDARVR